MLWYWIMPSQNFASTERSYGVLYTFHAVDQINKIHSFKNEVMKYALAQQVVFCLIRRKARVNIPGQASKHDMKRKTIFPQRFPLSRSLAKILGVHKLAMKKFLKNLLFGGNVKLTYKINVHNINDVRSQAIILLIKVL